MKKTHSHIRLLRNKLVKKKTERHFLLVKKNERKKQNKRLTNTLNLEMLFFESEK